MQKSLWKVSFVYPGGSSGHGVVSFDNGSVFGGDSSFYYLGTYTMNQNKISAQVKITQYANGVSIFGPQIREATVVIEGNLVGDHINFSGHLQQASNLTVTAQMAKLIDL